MKWRFGRTRPRETTDETRPQRRVQPRTPRLIRWLWWPIEIVVELGVRLLALLWKGILDDFDI